MKLTRNTKLCKATSDKGHEIIFRTLTVTELKVISNISSQFHKAELAFELGYISGGKPNFFIQQEIGRDVLTASQIELNDETLFALTVDEMRASIDEDMVFNLIQHIINVLPSTTIEYLLNLTYLDIIELAALCEKMSNKKIFTSNSSTAAIKQDEGFFPEDDSMSLQDKMKEMDNF